VGNSTASHKVAHRLARKEAIAASATGGAGSAAGWTEKGAIMRYWPLIKAALLVAAIMVIMVSVCHLLFHSDSEEVGRLVTELSETTSLTLRYEANGGQHRLVIRDKKQVAELLSQMQIQRVETAATGGYLLLAHLGEVDFCDDKGQTLVTLGFYKPSVLHWTSVGQVYLSNNSFEEIMAALASEKEGRHIDLTKRNDPRLGDDW
jgi:hypothetical protein